MINHRFLKMSHKEDFMVSTERIWSEAGEKIFIYEGLFSDFLLDFSVLVPFSLTF
jgi:hypothetical protein